LKQEYALTHHTAAAIKKLINKFHHRQILNGRVEVLFKTADSDWAGVLDGLYYLVRANRM
jgi:hypothetical protein